MPADKPEMLIVITSPRHCNLIRWLSHCRVFSFCDRSSVFSNKAFCCWNREKYFRTLWPGWSCRALVTEERKFMVCKDRLHRRVTCLEPALFENLPGHLYHLSADNANCLYTPSVVQLFSAWKSLCPWVNHHLPAMVFLPLKTSYLPRLFHNLTQ